MEAVRIGSKEALQQYLDNTRFRNPLSSAEIKQIVTSAIFDEDGFKGAYAKPLMQKLSRSERDDLLTALGINLYEGKPRMLYNHYPGADGKCGEKNDHWCAQY